MEKPQWRSTALAVAAAVLFGFSAFDASALALGRVTVQSALGEPLRAEIDIPEINAEELASLRTNIASPEAFKAAGMEYNAALTGIRITLERRPDGHHFLRLVSSRTVNDPFIDLILESSWASGRVVRDYTMLFDPPTMRQNTAPLSAEISPSAPASPTTSTRTAPAATGSRPAATARAERTPAAAAPGPAPRMPAGDGAKQVTVQGGDTAGKIAAANKPVNVSLDQMLVALLRANPDAFMGGNINRLRSGAVLQVPTAEQAALVPPDDARQTLVAQSRDFNEFRRRLAEGLPASKLSPADRQASGKITAQVEEKRPAAAAPDKLTLSKGAAQGKSGTEDKIARERAAQDTATRVAELNKNIADLNKLSPAAPGAGTGTGSGTAKPGVAVPLGAPVNAASAAKPAAPVAAPAPVASTEAAKPASSATTAAAAASNAVPGAVGATAATAAASAATAAASGALPTASAAVDAASAAAPLVPVAAAKPASAAKPAAKVAPPPETSFLDDLLENPLIPAGAAGVVLLLAGFGVYRVQQRKKTAQVDSSFLESRLQPDSFFGASGGQRIDTNEGGATGSSMVYSPSQLDAAGDVDPVAEADVYLAYGRDLQAEEILKEAMRTQPQRVAIYGKLLEIYAKRRDAKAFEVIASEAHGLTRGEGPEWEHICELGHDLDPSNPLYRPGGQPPAGAAAAALAAAGVHGSTVQTQAMPEAEPSGMPDIDLDLDFSLGDDQSAPAAPSAAAPAEQTVAMPAALEQMPDLDMDFGAATSASSAEPEAVRLDVPDLTLDENSLNFDLDTPAAAAPTPSAQVAAAASAPEAGMIEFDLGSLSLDLDPSAEPAKPDMETSEDSPSSTAGAPLSTAGFDDTGGDPLATKFALAQEFNAIGDPDGARSLAQEVLAEASGDLKTAAQRFLAEIG